MAQDGRSPKPRLSEAELRAVAAHGATRRFPSGSIVISEGERSDAFYIVLEGRLRAYSSDENGREVTLSVMGPGECFGEIAFDERPRSASVMTQAPSVLLVVPRHDLERLIRSNPDFAVHFIRLLIARVRTLTDSVHSLALMDARGRVARLLLEASVEVDGVQFVPERWTQEDIASRVGCTREMVSRILKSFVEERFITLQRDRIVLHRRPAVPG